MLADASFGCMDGIICEKKPLSTLMFLLSLTYSIAFGLILLMVSQSLPIEDRFILTCEADWKKWMNSFSMKSKYRLSSILE